MHPAPTNPLAAAKGCLWGIALSIPLWLCLFAGLLWLSSCANTSPQTQPWDGTIEGVEDLIILQSTHGSTHAPSITCSYGAPHAR